MKILILVVILLLTVACLPEYSEAGDPVRADYLVRSVSKNYQDNPVAWHKSWNGKRIETFGHVGNIKLNGEVEIRAPSWKFGLIGYVSCNFDDLDVVATFSPEDRITVTGRVNRVRYQTLYLDQCELVTHG